MVSRPSRSRHRKMAHSCSREARHSWMIISEVATFVIYAISMVVLPQYFGVCMRTALRSRQSCNVTSYPLQISLSS
jgi:hypothetical protein